MKYFFASVPRDEAVAHPAAMAILIPVNSLTERAADFKIRDVPMAAPPEGDARRHPIPVDNSHCLTLHPSKTASLLMVSLKEFIPPLTTLNNKGHEKPAVRTTATIPSIVRPANKASRPILFFHARL